MNLSFAKREQCLQFFRFCLIGLVNTSVSYINYYLFIRIGIGMAVSYALAYLVGMISSLLFNASWTFAVRRIHWNMTVKFVLANLLVAACGEWLLRPVVYQLHIPVQYAQLFTLIPTTVLNFMLSRFWVFRVRAMA
ncbi:membrane protein [Collibacillus ludicampi]|uniref:Membrane protein n=1 Tax=Collibacillus ludicampi TaxID=2771369 RepID=A0AAV4LCQ7_9BACL|nr:GtrA family protein [Collibacillus ludicampi]GIM45622.1 membrane protein [Collibacillus ludicampi]